MPGTGRPDTGEDVARFQTFLRHELSAEGRERISLTENARSFVARDDAEILQLGDRGLERRSRKIKSLEPVG